MWQAHQVKTTNFKTSYTNVILQTKANNGEMYGKIPIASMRTTLFVAMGVHPSTKLAVLRVDTLSSHEFRFSPSVQTDPP